MVFQPKYRVIDFVVQMRSASNENHDHVSVNPEDCMVATFTAIRESVVFLVQDGVQPYPAWFEFGILLLEYLPISHGSAISHALRRPLYSS